MDEKPLLLRSENGSEVAEAYLALFHGCGVTVHFVTGEKSRRIIAEANDTVVVGA